MPGFTIDITGLDALLHSFAEYQTIRDEEYAQASTDALNFVRSPLREYGPERQGQTYIRTMNLQGGWDNAVPTYMSTPTGFTATLDNPISYGPYVQGGPDETPHQTWVFADRWNTDDAILRDNEAEITRCYEDGTDRLAKRLAP